MAKAVGTLLDQLGEAVKLVRSESGAADDFSRGAQAGASMVMVRLAEIRRRDAALSAESGGDGDV